MKGLVFRKRLIFCELTVRGCLEEGATYMALKYGTRRHVFMIFPAMVVLYSTCRPVRIIKF